MFISEKLRRSNMAEYLIYMWQVEDLLRAFDLDFDKLKAGYLDRCDNVPEERREEWLQWYRDLMAMMRAEGLREAGHLQICRNVVSELSELHSRLTASPRFPYYRQAYMDVLPIIVTLRAKSGKTEAPELETCFDFLYGVLLLRMQGKPVSDETSKAQQTVAAMLGSLADYYQKDKETPLEFD